MTTRICMEKTKKNIFAILIIIISTSFSLILVEILLVLDNSFAPYENPNELVINNKRYSFLHKESDLKTSEPRLFVIGDSFVAGVHCAEENKNLTGHIQEYINKRKLEYKVINLGFPGGSPPYYIDFIKEIELKPQDIALVILYDNDIILDNEVCMISSEQERNYGYSMPKLCHKILTGEVQEPNNNSFIKRVNNKLKKYKIYQIIKEGLVQLPFLRKYFYRTEFQNLWIKFDSEENQYMQSKIEEIANFIKSKKAKFILSYYPNTNNIVAEDIRHGYWKKFLAHLNKRSSISSIDPFPYLLENTKRKSMVASLTDKHPSCEAHRIMADFFVNKNYFFEDEHK